MTRAWQVSMLCLLVFLLAYTSVEAACSGSSPNLTAASASRADVGDCVTAAVDGDTINIPSGSDTWNSQLSITNKSLILRGAGSGSTVLTSGLGATPLLLVSLNADVVFRITDIGFNLSTSDNGKRAIEIINATSGGTTPLTKIRVDHNAITGGGRYTVRFQGTIWGLVDHNVFTNAHVGIYVYGCSHRLWTLFWGDPASISSPGPQAGTPSALFVEDNQFLINSSPSSSIAWDAYTYYEEGCSIVTRYNTYTSTHPNPSFLVLALNDHGNLGTMVNGPAPYPNSQRGPVLHEFYNNTLSMLAGESFIGIRGNSTLIHDNTFTYTPGGAPGRGVVQFSEEETWTSPDAFSEATRTVWPAQDNVHNTFIWNNTLNGSAVTISHVVFSNNCCVTGNDSTFVQEDRDFFMHAPQATGGRTYWTGRPGGSTTAPTTSDVGTGAFDSGVANQYYPYTSYTYPHPLQGIAQTGRASGGARFSGAVRLQ